MRIHSETTTQQGSDYVYAMVNDLRTRPRLEPIGDSIAITIAAWWQSSGWGGKAFAELTSTGSADADDLIRNVEIAFNEAADDLDRYALIALWNWILHKAMSA